MKRAFWFWALFCILISIVYLYRASFKEELPPLEAFKSSPNIRVLLKSNSSSVTVETPSGSCEVWVDNAERPYKLKCKSLSASIEDGYFSFAGIRHQEKIKYLEIITKDKVFNYLGGEFKGKLRLSITKNGLIASILHMPLEPYIARVLDAEIHSSWAMETLKAQAIAARSYALFHMEHHRQRSYDLFGTSRSQAFKKIEPSYRSKKATLETNGLVMEFKGKLFPAYYISTCGGGTNKISYREILIKGVKCNFCKTSPYYNWGYTVKINRLEEIFSKWFSPHYKIHKLRIILNKDNRYVRFSDKKGKAFDLSLSIFRKQINKIFSREIIKSMRFTLQLNNDELKIKGNGWGYHGKGMCQYGAKTLGEKLYTYEEIIKYYYPGIQIAFIQHD